MRHARGIVAPLLCALALGACGGGAAADDAPAPVEQPQGTVEAPTAAADLTERHFTTWFEHGGQDEALAAWVRGAFGAGSVPRDISDGATLAQRHDAFLDWFSEPAHRAAVVRAWLREERRSAQARLRDALAASRVYAAAHAETFDGLSIGALKRIEPRLRYGVGPGRFGFVTLRERTPASIVLVTRMPDGAPVCISLNNGGDVGYGWVDPQTYAECVEEAW